MTVITTTTFNILHLSRGSREQVHLDVEQELKEAMSDTVASNLSGQHGAAGPGRLFTRVGPDFDIIRPDIRSVRISSLTLLKLSGRIFDILIFYIKQY